MGDEFARTEQATVEQRVDVAALAGRLDRIDVLLLKEFYHTGQPYPDDTISHVLRLLVSKLKRTGGPLSRLSYGAIRYRLENLVALGLLGRIPQTNPAVYYPLDWLGQPVRRIIMLFAAEFVGAWKSPEEGQP